MKNLWIAREFDDNNDVVEVFYSEREALAEAMAMKRTLTPGERKRRTVSVESYTAEIPDGLTAKEAYFRYVVDKDIIDRETYREV